MEISNTSYPNTYENNVRCRPSSRRRNCLFLPIHTPESSKSCGRRPSPQTGARFPDGHRRLEPFYL